MTLLERARRELARRSTPPTQAQQLVWFLCSDELRDLRAALDADPIDFETVARLEVRSAIRRRIGWLPQEAPKERLDRDTSLWQLKYDWCLHGIGGCQCLSQALDSGRRISSRRGVEHHARMHHERWQRETQPDVFGPKIEPKPERHAVQSLAKVLPFLRRPQRPAEPVVSIEPKRHLLDPALELREPLETVEELARRIGVPLMPKQGEEDR